MGIPKDLLSNPGLGAWAILTTYRGSITHGMYVANSIDDKDVLSVCVPPIDYYYGIHEAFPGNRMFPANGTQEIKRDEWDIVIYEARKFIKLLAQGNPNVLMALWLEPQFYMNISEAGQLLLDICWRTCNFGLGGSGLSCLAT